MLYTHIHGAIKKIKRKKLEYVDIARGISIILMLVFDFLLYRVYFKKV